MVDKKQKLQKIVKSQVVFFITLFLIVGGLFVILSPKISSILFPLKRQAILNDFINKTKIAGVINAQDYWKFREFYSPGFFTFSKNGIAKALSKNAEKEIGINYDEKAVNSAFLFFSSSEAICRLFLIPSKELPKTSSLLIGVYSVLRLPLPI